MRDALARHLPVIWIDARAPEHWQLLSAMPREPGKTASPRPGALDDAVSSLSGPCLPAGNNFAPRQAFMEQRACGQERKRPKNRASSGAVAERLKAAVC